VTRKIGVVTVARSDYGIYRPVLRALRRRDEVELRLYVGGSHLLERFGSSVAEIESDGYPIAERIDFLLPDDSPLAVASSLGRGVEAFATAFARTPSDLLVVLGDRFEMLAAGLAALPLTIPVAHLHGGETTEGAIDESARHALTKLSHLHFAATEEYARRIVQLGEEPWRVTVSGAPALDAIAGFTPLSDDSLAERGVRLHGPTLLVTFHPVTLEHEQTEAQVQSVLDAVESSGLDAVLTYPNADTRHRTVIERVEAFARSSDRYTVVRNLGGDAYFTLMSRAAAMVGNSSSGIIEAASFGLPVVDVGSRQRGRLRAANVIHAEPDADSIAAAIRRACSADFRAGLAGLANPYGDGRAAERIVERLATVPLDERLLVKRFHDLGTDA
jgi:UDP-hydrolysing UDP-N-acetyl-D-glucosamine 2-epimerase